MAGDRNGAGGDAPAPCPLCGEPLYGWFVLAPPARREARVERVIDRCENCGLVVERGVAIDLEAEWTAAGGGGAEIAVPNRASLQATIGLDGWAALDAYPGKLVLGPRSLELLAERTGHRLGPLRTPATRRAQGWMWQTLLNGLTFHANFARDLRAGRLRPATAISRPRFVADLLVTVLAAPLTLLVSAPTEAVAALLRRGGELRARVLADYVSPSTGA